MAIPKGKGYQKIKNSIFRAVCAFIPDRVENRTVIRGMEFLSRLQKLGRKEFPENIERNRSAVERHMTSMAEKDGKGYIEDQFSYSDMSFGKASMYYSGCEIIAAYNALVSLIGKGAAYLPELISDFERDGMMLSGRFGTSPKALVRFFEKRGFETELSTDEKEFDRMADRSDSLILTMYNDGKDLAQEIHTVNISREKGMFTAHNVNCNGTVFGPYRSVSDAVRDMNGGKARGIALIGIRKRSGERQPD